MQTVSTLHKYTLHHSLKKKKRHNLTWLQDVTFINILPFGFILEVHH